MYVVTGKSGLIRWYWTNGEYLSHKYYESGDLVLLSDCKFKCLRKLVERAKRANQWGYIFELPSLKCLGSIGLNGRGLVDKTNKIEWPDIKILYDLKEYIV